MTNEERIERIRATAHEHDGRYLLPQRFAPDPLNKSETDLDYDACAALVDRGEARWLSIDAAGPGIVIVRPPAPVVERPAMNLDEALSRLAAVHTRDDGQVGWCVRIGATPDSFMMEQGEYTRAWETVRRHLNLQVDPPE